MKTVLLCIRYVTIVFAFVTLQADANESQEGHLLTSLAEDEETRGRGLSLWESHDGESSSSDDNVEITVYTSIDFTNNLVPGTWDAHQLFCEGEEQRLCKLDELCPSRPQYYASASTLLFDQVFVPSFAVPTDVAPDNWVAYDTDDETRQDNCNVYGGCADNGWVQIGTWYPGSTYDATCNTHCEVGPGVSAEACPLWGAGEGTAYGPNTVVCCDGGNHWD